LVEEVGREKIPGRQVRRKVDGEAKRFKITIFQLIEGLFSLNDSSKIF